MGGVNQSLAAPPDLQIIHCKQLCTLCSSVRSLHSKGEDMPVEAMSHLVISIAAAVVKWNQL